MKRDFELIRKILSDVENTEAITPRAGFQYEGYEANVVLEHIQLLIEAELVLGKVSTMGPRGRAVIDRLTWKGHDFLGAAMDESLWSQAKETILKAVGGVAFELLLDWLRWKGREKLGMPQ